MPHFKLAKHIDAPIEEVFEVFSDLPKAADRIEGIVKIEMLTEGPVGRGTRWRETRILFKREATEELEITAFEPPTRYRVEAESSGAHYLTEFRFSPDGDAATSVEVEVIIRAVSLSAKLFAPLARLMMGSMKRLLDHDMEDLKAFLESREPRAAGAHPS